MELGLDYRTGIQLWILALIVELGLNYGSWPRLYKWD